MKRRMIGILSSFLLVISFQLKVISASSHSFIAATNKRLRFEGRWLINENNDGIAVADWPCSTIHFRVKVNDPIFSGLKLHWSGIRTRILVRIESTDISTTSSEAILLGPAFELPFAGPDVHRISFPSAGIFRVSIRKLNNAAPYGMGIANSFLEASVLKVYGLDKEGDISLLRPEQAPSRVMDFIGASDTAGYCVDGTTDMSDTYSELAGWEFDNCDSTYGGDLSKRFGAQVSFQASAGMGVTQNAAAAEQWQLGPNPLPALLDRTLMTNSQEQWPFNKNPVPDIVFISLGGNDFNHQGGNVPTNSTFSYAYKNLLLDLFRNKYKHRYSMKHPVIVSVCGQGSPSEGNDQNRCRACPHIERVVREFQDENPYGLGAYVEYIFVPCDGSVVTGIDDIGCHGHKNRLGQKRVADFLEPKVSNIMDWKVVKENNHIKRVYPLRYWYYSSAICVFLVIAICFCAKLVSRRRKKYTEIKE